MKKRMFSYLLAVVIIVCISPDAAALSAKASSQAVYVDGELQSFEAYSIDGYNYFKLRDIAFALNGTQSQFNVSYDEVNRAIVCITGDRYRLVGGEMFIGEDKSTSVKPSSQSLIIDSSKVELTAYNIGGNNFIKLRDLGGVFNFKVDYDKTLNAVIVESAGYASEELKPESIYSQCSPAVFYIDVYGENNKPLKNGSGFFISKTGIAITNYHVIDGGSYYYAFTIDGKSYNVSKIYGYSKEHDWAILQVDGAEYEFLDIGASDSYTGGAPIYTIGSPLGLQNTISQGLVSNPSRVSNKVEYIQISAPISSGSSGGALINKYGEVIGITSAYIVEGQNLNLAIPMTAIDFSVLSGENINITAYYTEYWPVPDFGKYAGLLLDDMYVSENGTSYYYYYGDLLANADKKFYQRYYELLYENGFTYDGSINILDNKTFHTFLNAKYAVYIGYSEVAGKHYLCVMVLYR